MLGVKVILSSPGLRSRTRGTFTGNRADPGHHFTLWQVAMTHKSRATVLELLIGEKRRHQRGQFRLDRLFDQFARAVANDLGERIRRNPGWIGQLGDGIVRHVAYPFLS
jgi:hypothetical protein